MPAQAVDLLDGVDVGDLVEVEVVFGLFLEDEGVVDGARGEVGVVDELAGAEEEGGELVVVEAPHAVRAGGLEVVRGLDGAHEAQVGGQDAQRERREGVRGEEGHPVQAEQPQEEVELVAGAVVDARLAAERVREVGGYLVDLGVVREAELGVPLGERGGYGVDEGAEGGVAEPGACFGGRVLGEDIGGVGQDRENGGGCVVLLVGAQGVHWSIAHAVCDAEYEGRDERACWALEEELVVFGTQDPARRTKVHMVLEGRRRRERRRRRGRSRRSLSLRGGTFAGREFGDFGGERRGWRGDWGAGVWAGHGCEVGE